jgi:putative peptidoglycan lipid II flippase
MTVETEQMTQSAPDSPARGIVGAATILAVGNVISRVLGLGRELVIADLFGASGYVSVFRVSSTLVVTLYDFLVGGMINAALVPTFSEYADRHGAGEKRAFWQLVSTVLSVLALLLGCAVLVLELLAEPLFAILGAGYDRELRAAGVQMIRLVLPAVFFLGAAGALSGVLLSLKRFVLPSFAPAIFNFAIIACGLVLAPFFGIQSIVVGVVVGAAAQALMQFSGLRGSPLRFSLDFRHPALRQIVRLYVPVLGGLAVMLVMVGIDRNLASFTGSQSLAWMQAATYLVQLPLGLVSTAVSLAILPSLSRAISLDAFRNTLGFGLKLVLLLILPFVVALFVLAVPVVGLVFEHGAFTANDTRETAQALRYYLLGTGFAAIDQPLIFAFYARKNTLLPNLVAVAGLGIYLMVALALLPAFGYLGLVLANSAQLAGHAVLMLLFTGSRLGGLAGTGLGETTLKLLGAGAVMGAVVYVMPVPLVVGGIAGELLQVALPFTAGIVAYVGVLKVLRVREWNDVENTVRLRLVRKKTHSG